MKLSKTTTTTLAVLVAIVADNVTTAFSFFGQKKGALNVASVRPLPFTIENIPGAVAPLGAWDPLGLASRADEATLKRYREAELTHGRVAMLAVLGFLVGEAVEGSSFLFDAQVTGPAITHLSQVPVPFWGVLVVGIGLAEQQRAEIGWVEPADVPPDQPGLLRVDYSPGDIGFDPLKLRPADKVGFVTMRNKELQNGRLAMIAAAGFMAQELVDGKGILEHWGLQYASSW